MKAATLSLALRLAMLVAALALTACGENESPAAGDSASTVPPAVTPVAATTPAAVATPAPSAPSTARSTPNAASCRLDRFLPPDALRVASVGPPPQTNDPKSGDLLKVTIATPADLPIALLLTYPFPATWELDIQAGADVRAVYLTGDGRQTLRNTSLPTFNATDPDLARCSYGYIAADAEDFVDPISERLFGRKVDQIFYVGPSGLLIQRVATRRAEP